MDKKNEKSKALKPKEETALVPRLSGKTLVGLEEVDLKEDVIMPRVAILQGLSKLVIDGKGRMGELANSVTKEIYGESIDFIPLYLFKTRVMFEIGKGLVAMSRDGIKVTQVAPGYEFLLGKSCLDLPEAQWQDNEPPKLSLVYNFPSLIIDRLNEFPVSISLMRTSAKTGRTLISMILMGGEDIFARKYRLLSVKQTNELGTFAIANIEFLGRCSNEEYSTAKKVYEIMRAKPVEVEMEEEQPEYSEHQ